MFTTSLLFSFLALPSPSAMLQSTCGGNSYASPPGLPSGFAPVVWLKNAGLETDVASLVSKWTSALGNVFEQDDGYHRPLLRLFGLNGSNVLHFDGNDYLNCLTSMPTGNYTKAVLFVFEDTEKVGRPDIHLFSGQSDHALYLKWHAAESKYRLAFSNDYSNPLSAPVVHSMSIEPGIPTVAMASYDAGTGTVRLYQIEMHPPGSPPCLSGVLEADPATMGSASDNDDMTMQVGVFGVVASFFPVPNLPAPLPDGLFFTGSIAEVQVYDHALTQPELDQLFASYFFPKFGQLWIPAVSIEGWPRDGQLYPRDVISAIPDGTGTTITIEATAATGTATCANALVLEVQKDTPGQPAEFQCFVQVLSTTSLQLVVPVELEAGLHTYHFTLSLRVGSAYFPVARAANVVCGDAFLINGQSNAVAADYFLEEPLDNVENQDWIRSFGHSSPYASAYLPDYDLHWSRATISSYDISDPAAVHDQFAHGAIGTLAMGIADLLVERRDVPIAFLQGGLGASCIANHLPDALDCFGDPLALPLIYQTLLDRAQAAELADKLGGMVWMQGHNDGAFLEPPCPTTSYESDYHALLAAWETHYGPAPFRVFAVQSRTAAPVCLPAIQEVQREIAHEKPNVWIMSTTATRGLLADDAIHFHVFDLMTGEPVGYFEIAARVALQIEREVYGDTTISDEADPPDLLELSACKTQVLSPPVPLRFDIHVAFDRDVVLTEVGPFKNDVVVRGAGGGVLTVNSAWTSGNILTVRVTGVPAKISYVGHIIDETPPGWLTSLNGQVGALNFEDLAIGECSH